eukprot:7058679-Pyramimonas_sp.AAC.1
MLAQIIAGAGASATRGRIRLALGQQGQSEGGCRSVNWSPSKRAKTDDGCPSVESKREGCACRLKKEAPEGGTSRLGGLTA